MQSRIGPGEIVDGKYRVERVLGQGGMGTVVLAHHLKLDQPVAIKVLHLEAMAHEHVVKRFQSEARAVAKIRSQHVARVIDVGELPSGLPFMVMEYLEGNDLSKELKLRGALPVSEAATYLIEACDALAEAHAAGIVHRDLKPANLYLARSPQGTRIAKVLDFGISKMTSPGQREQLTATHMVMGTPQYMSPEQIKSTRDVDARSDIWALGIILFELLTDDLPFGGDNSGAVIAQILSELPRPLRPSRPDCPPELEAVVLRALERDKERRYQTVAEFAQALAPFAIPSVSPLVSNIQRVIGSTLITRASSFAVPPSFSAPSPESLIVSTSSDASTIPESARLTTVVHGRTGPGTEESTLLDSKFQGASLPGSSSGGAGVRASESEWAGVAGGAVGASGGAMGGSAGAPWVSALPASAAPTVFTPNQEAETKKGKLPVLAAVTGLIALPVIAAAGYLVFMPADGEPTEPLGLPTPAAKPSVAPAERSQRLPALPNTPSEIQSSALKATVPEKVPAVPPANTEKARSQGASGVATSGSLPHERAQPNTSAPPEPSPGPEGAEAPAPGGPAPDAASDRSEAQVPTGQPAAPTANPPLPPVASPPVTSPVGSDKVGTERGGSVEDPHPEEWANTPPDPERSSDVRERKRKGKERKSRD